MNDFINSLLNEQHVAKRSPKRLHNFNKSAPKAQTASGRNFEKPAFRPEGITALFTQNVKVIERIRQEPVKSPRRNAKIKKLFQKRQSVSANEDVHERVLPDRAQYGTPSDEAESSKPQKRRERSWTSFAVSAFSITAVFLAVIGVYYIVQSQNLNLDWTSQDVINTSPDSPIQHSLARYAGVPLESAITVWETPLDGAPVQVIAGATQAMAGTMQAMVTGAQAPREIPLDLMETFEWQSYRVQRGDSVSTIAQRFSVSMDAIIASNNITNARALRAGELLRIPNMDGIPHVVESGDSLAGISARFGVPLEAILDANDIQSDVIYSGTTLFIPGARMNRDELRMALGDQLFVHPVRGARLTSPFGWRNDPFTGVRRHHAAIDLAAPQGTPIVAAKDGRVSAIGYDRVFGNFIILTHANNFQTLYAHMHTTAVRRGDQVRQGARIGTVGNTGLSTGPHLHFAIYRNNRAVNPLDFLNARR